MDIRTTFFFSLLAIGTAAHAEGVYVLASGGKSQFGLNLDRSDLDATMTDVGLTVDSSKLDKSDSAYKLQLGYQFNDNFSIEGGYVDLGAAEYNANFSGFVFGHYQAKLEAKGWNLDGLLTLPINSGVSLFFKGGIFRGDVKASEKVNSFSVSGSKTRITPNFGVGVAYNFYKGLSARAEIERFSNLRAEDEEGFEVKANVDLYSLGISYQF